MFGFKKWHRNRIASRQFPAQWHLIILKNAPFFKRLSSDDQAELKRHILIFLNEKYFEGCGGLEMTEEIKVTIAAYACLLLLHRKTDYYPGLTAILVYPTAYIVRESRHVGDGIMAEGIDVRIGESWHSGTVVLSWDDVKRKASDIRDGHNVVFHEFAHQLDSSGGKLDNTPVLENRSAFISWARTLEREYHKLCSQAVSRHPTFLNKYGATDPAEFFAVATEYFFERPAELRKLLPDLYKELQNFYQQDPAKIFG